MKRNLTLAWTALILATIACNALVNIPVSRLDTGPTQTLSIDEPLPAGSSITDARLTVAPSSAAVMLAGGAGGLVEGEIRYNVAEWEPVLSTGDGTLRITQDLPDERITTSPEGGINEWDLKLGSELVNVHLDCPAGNFTLDFADTLPDGAAITVEMGAGNLRLVIPDGVAASVQVTRGPSTVKTEGAWAQDGSTYTANGGGPAWTFDINMGVGNLTLANR